MSLFHVVEDTFVILRHKGIFRQAKVYQRDDRLYGQWGSGFVQLVTGGGTTHPNTSWIEFWCGSEKHRVDSAGRPRLIQSKSRTVKELTHV